MPKRKKGQRTDGLIEIARKMPSGKTRHYYGHSRAECEDKSRHSDCMTNPHECLKIQVFMRVFLLPCTLSNAHKSLQKNAKTHSRNRKKIAVRDSHSLLTM